MEKKIYEVEKYQDMKEMLEKTGKLYGDKTAYLVRKNKKEKFCKITHNEFRNQIKSLGTKLVEMGLKDKRVAVIAENRYEWAVSYFAVATGTGVVVPLDKSLPENEIEGLIRRSNVEALIYEDKYSDTVKTIMASGKTNLKHAISMDLEENKDGVLSFYQLVGEGAKLIEGGNRTFLDATINNKEMGIMLFTSGTTSLSKAVMLSHENICTNIWDILSVMKIYSTDRFLSFLPLHHTFECTAGFIAPISVGATIVFCDGLRHIGDNIKEYKITAMVAVPLLFEAMYKKVMSGIEKKGKLPKVKKAIKVGRILRKVKIDVRKKLFKEIHKSIGEDLRIFVSGGAGLDSDVHQGFEDLGFTVYQGYGLTESSPVIAAESDFVRKVGSIGNSLPNVEVKIIEPNEEGIGELLARGPSIMLGYYENEEATKETLDEEGWLHTGDLAKIDKDGYIFISGRKKFVIVLKNGKNIYPEELEIVVNKIEGVVESFVYGKQEPDGDYKICVKLVYDEELYKDKGDEYTEEKIKEELFAQIKKVNKTFPPYKYIREVVVTKEELIKTTTRKIKRFEEMKTVIKM